MATLKIEINKKQIEQVQRLFDEKVYQRLLAKTINQTAKATMSQTQKILKPDFKMKGGQEFLKGGMRLLKTAKPSEDIRDQSASIWFTTRKPSLSRYNAMQSGIGVTHSSTTVSDPLKHAFIVKGQVFIRGRVLGLKSYRGKPRVYNGKVSRPELAIVAQKGPSIAERVELQRNWLQISAFSQKTVEELLDKNLETELNRT